LVENFLWLQNHFLEKGFGPNIFIQKILVDNLFCCKIICLKTRLHQKFTSKNYGRKFFIVAKSFLRKLVCTENIHQKNFVRIFFCFKIISSETGLDQHFHQKNFGRKFFIVAKSFPRKLVSTKNFHQKNFGRNFFIVAKSFPRKLVCTKNFHKKSLVENCLLLQNHFLENWFAPKIFIKTILVEIVFCFIIIYSKTGLDQNFHQKNFGRNFFMVAKSFPRKQVRTKYFHQKNFGRTFFIIGKSFTRKLVCTKNFLKKKFWLKIFCCCKIISSKTGLHRKF